ncbi:hypothetical protein GCM10009850_081070 [Nonomuraea monospora]|uniref:histidine kinase n=1 Tax=Nonomuraea monospora TaxID=568818 RepID=A0ABP5PPB7_9ACTN
MDEQRHPEDRSIDVVAMITSAGGLVALINVLRALPAQLPAAVVVQQHLGGQGSALTQILSQRTGREVAWTVDGGLLSAGQILVCPPRARMEVLPDGTCAVIDREVGARDHPHDALLRSLADAYGSRGLAVVLTGMGRDGAKGAVAVRESGGFVIAQSAESAEHESMPSAAAPAAHLVLPLGEIGSVVGDMVHGRPLPRPRSEIEAAAQLFHGPGEIERLLRAKDWFATPLGPVTQWPPVLRAMVRTTLDSGYPMAVWWGPRLIQIYNELWRQFLGTTKHPQALVGRAEETWPELWWFVGPMTEHVMTRGQATGGENMPMLMDRNGLLEEVFATFTYSPITDASGAVAGIHNTALDTTATMVGERRMRTLRAVAAQTTGAETPRRACELAAAALASEPADVPFVLLYLLDHRRRQARLAGAAGLEPGTFAAPHLIDLALGGAVWPVPRLLGETASAKAGDRGGMMVENLDERFKGLLPPPPTPAGALPPRAAFLLPMHLEADANVPGVLIVGLNPHRPFDDGYRGFLDLLTGQISAAVAQARARWREQQRLQRLADLDRAKTEFFSNVSHEFRTPLTLMLAPLEEMLTQADRLPGGMAAEVALVHRNARRLLRLVGTLLDFSAVEAGRLRAHFVPTDLAALTAEIASMFRSAATVAGLELIVDTPPLPEAVWVDQEMWEKIVSNLISNALKFTWTGSIKVYLRALPKHAELVVRDTGVGIPAAELPHIFKRFHRVPDVRGRTHEGVGIGLALVDELIRRHHGRARVTSEEGGGTTFTVWLPLGRRPALGSEPAAEPHPGAIAAAMAEEARHWDADREQTLAAIGLDDTPLPDGLAAPGFAATLARVLVVDDNADMRDYLARLLSPAWEVSVAGDGEEALRLARRDPPDLVLADVMMPRLDGFALLRGIRSDETLAAVPVILVTARAGEETAIEGLLAGADDYVVKPFSARELVARVEAQLQLAGMRRRVAATDAYRLALTDALRSLEDPTVIQQRAVEILGRELRVENAHYAEVDTGAGLIHVYGDYSPGRPPLRGTYPLADWGGDLLARTLGKGETLVVADVTATDMGQDAQARWLGAGACAVVEAPLINVGRWVGHLAVLQSLPRKWTADEIAIVEETAVRTWAFVQRARAEQELRESEQRFRSLADAAPALIWHLDTRGLTRFVNRRYLDYTGLALERVLGEEWHHVLHPDDADGYLAALRGGAASRGAWQSRARIRGHDGLYREFETHASPLFDRDGTYLGQVGISFDVTSG